MEGTATAKCELCGNTILGLARYVIVEGSRIMTCSECAKYSSGEWKPPRKPRQGTARPRRIRTRSSAEMVLREEEVRVVRSYSTVIKEAREKLGWPLEQLASKVGLKVSQVRKIEAGKLVPSLKEAKVLEHVLRISLIVPAETGEVLRDTKAQTLTIGDVIDFRDETEK